MKEVMLQYEYFLGFETAENEPSKICQHFSKCWRRSAASDPIRASVPAAMKAAAAPAPELSSVLRLRRDYSLATEESYKVLLDLPERSVDKAELALRLGKWRDALSGERAALVAEQSEIEVPKLAKLGKKKQNAISARAFQRVFTC